MRHEGGCHCGAIRFVYESARPPAETKILACQCGFCRKHGMRAIADPEGSFRLIAKQAGALEAYRFGLRTADFLLCKGCGVYVTAILAGDSRVAIVNVNALDDPSPFTSEPLAAVYDDETEAGRRARRLANWTPVIGEIRG